MTIKFLASLIITLALTAPLLAQTPGSGEGEVNRELNEAAAAYKEGDFAAAQAHSEKALLLDPQNKIAPYFVARTIHSQYKPGDSTTDNIEKARQAINAYKRILERWPADDEAYKAVAFLYIAIKEDEQFRAWVLQRAANVAVSDDKRAEAFIVLASKDWDCSFKITEVPGTKVITFDRNAARVSFRMPKQRAQFERAKECANSGLEMVNMAITLAPDNESAWSYKASILLELGKLAEMTGQIRQKHDLQRQYEEALDEATRIANAHPARP